MSGGVLECLLALGCARWMWRRCTYAGSYDSVTWSSATADDFEPVPRVCHLIHAVYQPAGEHRLNPDWVVKRVAYDQTLGQAPPYIIYTDHDHREIVLAVRGLNLVRESDYKVLLDNRLGMQRLDGGYVHRGLLKSAVWLLNRESETLRRLWVENGSDYRMVFAGHSLGSGVVSLLTIMAANYGERLGGIPVEKIRCYAVAPARCMSLNLAVKYANVIHAVVLQDDFLPRMATPLEDIFKSIFCLPCLLYLVCLKDTFTPQGKKLSDPRRLYAPGRMYHIVERKFCRCGRFPPEVRTAIPVDGRFEHIVLSCNATSDHAIAWIEREAEKALQEIKDSTSDTVTVPPTVQRFESLRRTEKEHEDALQRAASLIVPHAVDTADKEPSENNEGKPSNSESRDTSGTKSKSSGGMLNWDEVIEQLSKRNDSGDLGLKTDTNIPQ